MTQYITDYHGNKTHVVVAVDKYQRLLDIVELEEYVRDFDKVIPADDAKLSKSSGP